MVFHEFTNGGAVQGHGNLCEIELDILFGILNGRHNSFSKPTQTIERNVFVFDFDDNSQCCPFLTGIVNIERFFQNKFQILSCFLESFLSNRFSLCL